MGGGGGGGSREQREDEEKRGRTAGEVIITSQPHSPSNVFKGKQLDLVPLASDRKQIDLNGRDIKSCL